MTARETKNHRIKYQSHVPHNFRFDPPRPLRIGPPISECGKMIGIGTVFPCFIYRFGPNKGKFISRIHRIWPTCSCFKKNQKQERVQNESSAIFRTIQKSFVYIYNPPYKSYMRLVRSSWYMFILIRETSRWVSQNWNNKNTQYIYLGLSDHHQELHESQFHGFQLN